MIDCAVPLGRLCTPRWNVASLNGTVHSTDSKQHGSFDIIVVGNRNHACQPELVLDLIVFELKGSQRRKGRRPIGFQEI
jgi:hypothetical protein